MSNRMPGQRSIRATLARARAGGIAIQPSRKKRKESSNKSLENLMKRVNNYAAQLNKQPNLEPIIEADNDAEMIQTNPDPSNSNEAPESPRNADIATEI